MESAAVQLHSSAFLDWKGSRTELLNSREMKSRKKIGITAFDRSFCILIPPKKLQLYPDIIPDLGIQLTVGSKLWEK